MRGGSLRRGEACLARPGGDRQEHTAGGEAELAHRGPAWPPAETGAGRGGEAAALGLASLVAAWTFGSLGLAVTGAGLVLAGVAARGWARAARSGVSAQRRPYGTGHVEGDDVRVEVVVRQRRLLPLGGAAAVQSFGPGRVAEARLSHGRAEIVLERVPRGSYVLEPASLVLDDPLGLERVVLPAGEPAALVVRPTIVDLQTLFTDTGTRGDGGRRALLRRQSGFELHAVRDHREGESLRAVHWPSTARRARLMVRELDDAPRDDVAVVLDQDPAGLAGPAGQSSLDAAVRAAGSLVRAHAARGRRVALVLTGGAGEVVRVGSLGRDWEEALISLAAVRADATRTLADVLASPRGAAARAPELVVVTCLAGVAVDALARRHRPHPSALVHVDAPTFAGVPPAPPTRALLHAAARGVQVAVVRRGDDLRSALDGSLSRRARA